MFFKNIKCQIKEIAKNAVFLAEKELGNGKGKEKKELAIKYVVNNLPFSEFVKPFVAMLLSKFIDEVIEVSVTYMQSMQESKGENYNDKSTT